MWAFFLKLKKGKIYLKLQINALQRNFSVFLLYYDELLF
jgi:hypothetical protein